jgi:hypothetical protein
VFYQDVGIFLGSLDTADLYTPMTTLPALGLPLNPHTRLEPDLSDSAPDDLSRFGAEQNARSDWG